MVTVDGIAMDIRRLPIELMEMAYENGLIPYVPGYQDADTDSEQPGT